MSGSPVYIDGKLIGAVAPRLTTGSSFVAAGPDSRTGPNTPPQITKVVAKGGVVQWHVADTLSVLRRAEYSLTLKGLTRGEHTIAVRATDDFDNVAVEKLIL